jgi:hypothetical protein
LFSFDLEKLKIRDFFALVIATKNNLLSSSNDISFSKFLYSFSSKSLYCKPFQIIQIGSFNLSGIAFLFQFHSYTSGINTKSYSNHFEP